MPTGADGTSGFRETSALVTGVFLQAWRGGSGWGFRLTFLTARAGRPRMNAAKKVQDASPPPGPSGSSELKALEAPRDLSVASHLRSLETLQPGETRARKGSTTRARFVI